jgi:hypothetical protein
MPTPLDTPWKQILESYFPQFLAFFFPNVHNHIDWSRGFEFLDGELQQITREAETGKRILDKLVKVYLYSGSEQWILIHLEVQNQKEDEFPERVYIYHSRLRDKFRRPIVSLAVLGDTSSTWRPQSFQEELLGCGVQFSFPITKLVDYKQHQPELEASSNPFAVVVQAHLAAQATKGIKSQQRRKTLKFQLVIKLYEKGYSRQEVIDLFRFIDWVLTLPANLETAFRTDLTTYEGEKQMAYISSIERLSKAEGKAEVVLSQLQRKLKLIDPTIATTIMALSVEQIEQLAEDLLDFQTPQDLNDWLTSH